MPIISKQEPDTQEKPEPLINITVSYTHLTLPTTERV